MADFCDSVGGELSLSSALVNDFGRREQARLAAIASGGNESAFELTRLMQETMTAQVGIFRDRERLEQAVSHPAGAATAQPRYRPAQQRTGRQPGAGHRLPPAAHAEAGPVRGLRRAAAHREPRRALLRADYPRRDDLNWMRRTLARWPEAEAGLPTLEYEALDIMQMELPPGWRGYGARDYIEHPDTALRQQQVDEIVATVADADRHARQQALMPFRHLLPAHLRHQPATGRHLMKRIPACQASRTLRLQVLPQSRDPASEPHLQTFEVEEADSMTLFIALTEIRERQDPSCSLILSAAPVSAAVAA